MSKKFFFIAVIVAALALFLIMRSEKSGRLDLQVKGDSFFEGLKIINKKDGAIEWMLLARRADITRDGKEALMSGVEMTLNRQGLTVEAEKGVYNMETKQVSIDGVIRAKNRNYVITTSQALIDSGKGTLETGGEVKIEGRKFNLEGRGLQADNKEQKVRVMKDVKATFNR